MPHQLTDNSDNVQLKDQKGPNCQLVKQKIIIISMGFCMGYIVASGVNYFLQDQMVFDVRENQITNKNKTNRQLSCLPGNTNFFIPAKKINYPFYFFSKHRKEKEADEIKPKEASMDLFIYFKSTSLPKVFVLSQNTPIRQVSKHMFEVCVPSHLVPKAIWGIQNGTISMTRATGVKFPSHQLSIDSDSPKKENIQIFERSEEW